MKETNSDTDAANEKITTTALPQDYDEFSSGNK